MNHFQPQIWTDKVVILFTPGNFGPQDWLLLGLCRVSLLHSILSRDVKVFHLYIFQTLGH